MAFYQLKVMVLILLTQVVENTNIHAKLRFECAFLTFFHWTIWIYLLLVLKKKEGIIWLVNSVTYGRLWWAWWNKKSSPIHERCWCWIFLFDQVSQANQPTKEINKKTFGWLIAQSINKLFHCKIIWRSNSGHRIVWRLTPRIEYFEFLTYGNKFN